MRLGFRHPAGVRLAPDRLACGLVRSMAKFYNNDMADLAHQLTISPRRLRVEQILGIERLYLLIDPDKAYPFDFVCHAITGLISRANIRNISRAVLRPVAGGSCGCVSWPTNRSAF